MKTIGVHPNNMTRLKQLDCLIRRAGGPEMGEQFNPPSLLVGFEIIVSENFPEFSTEWEFKKEPFIEYEKSDLPWVKYCGLAKLVENREKPIVTFLNFDAWTPDVMNFRF